MKPGKISGLFFEEKFVKNGKAEKTLIKINHSNCPG
jgi:hypothetical protein